MDARHGVLEDKHIAFVAGEPIVGYVGDNEHDEASFIAKTIDELHDAVRAGTVQEAFACGTAAVVTPIGALVDENGRFELPSPIGEVTMTIRQRLLDIQFGRVEDPYGWTQQVC